MIKYSVIALALTACAATEPKVTIKEVKIPVLHCPAPPQIEHPVLPIYTMTDTATDADVVMMYEASLIMLEAYARKLELVVSRYQRISDSQSTK